MKSSILLFLVMSVYIVEAQEPVWYTDFNKAKSVCKSTGKLMVIDFWADWCMPCKVMDEEFWNNADIDIHYPGFVALKINVDKDPLTPPKFEVDGIPKIVVTMPDGRILWEKVGFMKGDDFSDVLNAIPGDVSDLYKYYFSTNSLGKDSECAFQVGRRFQQLAASIENLELKEGFISQDEFFFRKALKDNTAPALKNDIEAYLLLNEVYLGHADKALKKFGKLETVTSPEVRHFFLASCYKALNQIDNFDREYQLLTNSEMKSLLVK